MKNRAAKWLIHAFIGILVAVLLMSLVTEVRAGEVTPSRGAGTDNTGIVPPYMQPTVEHIYRCNELGVDLYYAKKQHKGIKAAQAAYDKVCKTVKR